jgi:hypothetical protein
MRAFCVASLAVGLIVVFSTDALATSVLSTTNEGGEPYYSGPAEAVSTNLVIGGSRCERSRLTGRVTAGSSTVNSAVNPFTFAGFACRVGSPSANKVNEWTATFNVAGLTATINNFEITELESLNCTYKGNITGSYTNPVPPARAKITMEAGARLAFQRGSFFCSSSLAVRGIFDFAAIEPVRDLYLVSR